MPKRSARNSRRTRRESRSNTRQSGRTVASRRKALAGESRYQKRRLGRTVRRSTDESPGETRTQAVSRRAGLRVRRSILRPDRKKTSVARLPELVLSARPFDENAHRKTDARQVCARKKQQRRAVIIATGSGGINHAKRYRSHSKCR